MPMDEIAVDRIPDWEAGFYQYAASNYPEIGNTIDREKVISDQTEDSLQLALNDYNKQFV